MNDGGVYDSSESHRADMVDHYWGSMSAVQGLIRSSELKAGLVLSFYGILLNFVYRSYQAITVGLAEDLFLMVGVVLWFLATATSIYFCVRCFIPRIEGNYDSNVFFFKDVISKFGDIKEFSSTFWRISMSEKELFGQMGEQIYIISKIADWKFKSVQRAIRFLGVALFFLLCIVVYAMLRGM